jgi:predicted O-methyltransferase YrrM
LSEKTFETTDGEPLNCDITHGAFANPMLKAVLHKFGKRAFARSSACMEFEAFLRRINAGGGTCLEIGTYNGITAVVLSQFFDKVICVSVDAEDLKRNIIKTDIVDFLDIKNITFHDCKNNAQKARIVNSLEFDFAFSDGDHTNDAQADFDLVKRCGRVLQHEAWPIQASVWNLLHSLPQDEVTWADHDCFAYWNAKRG